MSIKIHTIEPQVIMSITLKSKFVTALMVCTVLKGSLTPLLFMRILQTIVHLCNKLLKDFLGYTEQVDI